MRNGVVWGITNCCAKLGGSLEFLSIFAKASTEFDSYIPIFWFIMFIAVFQTMLTFGILIYGRNIGSYTDNMMVEFHSRNTGVYMDCVTEGRFLTLIDTFRAIF